MMRATTERILWLRSRGRPSFVCPMGFTRKSTSRRIARAMRRPYLKPNTAGTASYPARGVSIANDLGRFAVWASANHRRYHAFSPGVRIYGQCCRGLRGHFAPAATHCGLAAVSHPGRCSTTRPESALGYHQHMDWRSGIGEPRHELTGHDDGVFVESAALRSDRTRTDRLQPASGLYAGCFRTVHAGLMRDLGCSGTDRIGKLCSPGRCRDWTSAVWCSCRSGVRAFVATGSSTDQTANKFVP